MKFLQFFLFCWSPTTLLELNRIKKVQESACWKFWLCRWHFYFLQASWQALRFSTLVIPVYSVLFYSYMHRQFAFGCSICWFVQDCVKAKAMIISRRTQIQLYVLWVFVAHCMYWHIRYLDHLERYSASMR